MNNWIQTYSGVRFAPLSSRPEDIHLVDICHALCLVNRFTGHTRFPWSVAAHSIEVARLAYELSGRMSDFRWGLLHDASEAYIADVARPVKHQPEMAAYREAEKRLMRTIAERFGLGWPEPEVVKQADMMLLATERRDCLMREIAWDGIEPTAHFTPIPRKMVERDWRDVRSEFRILLNMNFPAHAIKASEFL